MRNAIVINGEEYNYQNGISFIKTKYSENYDEIPEKLKHKEIKKRWSKYPRVPDNLQSMVKSKDRETLELACKLLDDLGITYSPVTSWDWSILKGKKHLTSIVLFK